MRLTKDQKREKYRMQAATSRRKLEWECYDDDGTYWKASSVINDEGSRFEWRVDVTEIGRFTIANSDRELIDPEKYKQGYTSLQAAQNVCQSLEDGLVVSLNTRPE